LAEKLTTSQSLRRAFQSWRLAAVSLLSFSSGLPLGLVITAVPFWMQQEGLDIRQIGLVTLAQAPYTFKFLWSPLMDRFAPRRGRKRLWIAVGQVSLAASVAAFALYTHHPALAAITLLTLLVSFASATQDIAIDAYTVEVLHPSEQGLAVGARIALYRAAMYVSGAVAVWLGPKIGWEKVFIALGAAFLLLLPVTVLSPEPEAPPAPPSTLRAAVWEPFVGFFRHPRALEIASFLFLYKLADNVAMALIRPFLGQLGFDSFDVGVATGTIGLVATLGGTFVGGICCSAWGVGRALWVFGIVQALAHGGYALVAQVGVNRPLMYAAMAVESTAIGLGTGAFNVLLLRLTQRRFSATQYALFSSIFALGRTVSGPPAGALVFALGWRDFFLLTIPMALPGLWMLSRFVPWGVRDLPQEADGGETPPPTGTPLSPAGLALRGLLGAAVATTLAYLASAALDALRALRAPGGRFDLGAALGAMLHPVRAGDWLGLLGPPIAGIIVGFGVAAYFAARRGVAFPGDSG